MRTLYIAPGFGMDVRTGGGQRTKLVFEALNSFSEVDVMPVGAHANPFHREVFPEAGQILDGLFGRKTLFGLLPRIARHNRFLANKIFRLITSRRDHFTADAVSRATMSGVNLSEYDLIVGRYLEPISKMGVLETAGDTPVLIDIDDRDDSKMLNMAENASASLAKRLYARRLYRQLVGIFAEKIALADHLWLASIDDLDGIEHVSKTVLPNIPFLTISDRYEPRTAEQPGRILFIGHARHLPNRDGLQAFVAGAWQQIRQAVPDARLRVIGRSWTDALVGAGPDQGVDTLGFVEDLEDEYAAASIVIAPVMEGGGTKIKVLEAMQFQKPVVAHRHSTHGFHSEGEAIFRSCETMDQMAIACLDLMQDEGQRRALIAAGNAYVLANHSRQMFMRRIREDCDAVLTRKGRVASSG